MDKIPKRPQPHTTPTTTETGGVLIKTLLASALILLFIGIFIGYVLSI